VSTIEFTIQRDPKNDTPDGIEYWVYDEILGLREQGDYIIVSMLDRSAFIPKPWIVNVKEL
tara:strand:+ start:601 stop:783 length:183 start_codon:yes stop_codon:yes gene_type:complete